MPFFFEPPHIGVMDQEGAGQSLTGEARLAAYLDAIAGVLGHAGREAAAQALDSSEHAGMLRQIGTAF